MKTSSPLNVYVALIHHPVVNKTGDIIASAVTNLDIHDIARASKTYGVNAFYIVTPLSDQQTLCQQIIDHWISGHGAIANPIRREALELVYVKGSLSEVIESVRNDCHETPKQIVTCARELNGCIGYASMRETLHQGGTYLICFGTAWGLSEEFIAEADYVLAPVKGMGNYNHLSVRCATAIILDRLMGESK